MTTEKLPYLLDWRVLEKVSEDFGGVAYFSYCSCCGEQRDYHCGEMDYDDNTHQVIRCPFCGWHGVRQIVYDRFGESCYFAESRLIYFALIAVGEKKKEIYQTLQNIMADKTQNRLKKEGNYSIQYETSPIPMTYIQDTIAFRKNPESRDGWIILFSLTPDDAMLFFIEQEQPFLIRFIDNVQLDWESHRGIFTTRVEKFGPTETVNKDRAIESETTKSEPQVKDFRFELGFSHCEQLLIHLDCYNTNFPHLNDITQEHKEQWCEENYQYDLKQLIKVEKEQAKKEFDEANPPIRLSFSDYLMILTIIILLILVFKEIIV